MTAPRFAVAGVLAAALSVAAAAAPPDAPDFSLSPVGGGAPVRLSSLKGKVVLLDFWSTTCGPCRIWKPFFETLDKTYAGKGLAVVGVDAGESEQAAAAYLKAHPTTLKTTFDAADSVRKSFFLKAVPAMVLFDADGTLMWSSVGFGPSTKDDLTWRIENALPEPAPASKGAKS